MMKEMMPIPASEDLQSLKNAFQKFCIEVINRADPHDQNSAGILILAATYIGDYSVVKCLVENTNNEFGIYGHVAARAVIETKDCELLELIFKYHPDWFTSDILTEPNMMYPIEMAAIDNQIKMVEFLLPYIQVTQLSRPFSINTSIGPIPPLLFYLLLDGNHQMLRLILSKKPNLEERNWEDYTPLSFACFRNDLESAFLLIQAGANVNVSVNSIKAFAPYQMPQYNNDMLDKFMKELSTTQGLVMHPLEIAASHGNLLLVYLLLKSGAKVDTSESTLGSALQLASRSQPLEATVVSNPDYPNVVRLLLIYNAKLDSASDKTGNTALHDACKAGQTEIAIQLLTAGANANTRNLFGEQVANLLVKMGVKIPNSQSTKLKLQRKLESEKRKALLDRLETSLKQLSEKLNSKSLDSVPTLTLEKKKKKKKKKKKPSSAKQISEISNQYNKNDYKGSEQPVVPIIIETMPTTSESIPSVLSHEEKISSEKDEKSEVSDVSKSITDNAKEPAVTEKPRKNSSLTTRETTTRSATQKMSSTNIIPKPSLSLFKSDIPTGKVVRKFPLRLEGISFILYYVFLIPDKLNEMFSSDRVNELKKIWAAILTERLLPSTSQNKAGVKILSSQEKHSLRNGFFKRSTHKIKPNTEDTRVYLEAKHSKEKEKNEIHLDLIGPDFNPH